MAALVDTPVVPGEAAPNARVRAVAQADRVAVAAARLGADGDGYGERLGVAIAGQDAHVREVVAVLERVLRAADAFARKGLAGLEPDVALQQLGRDRVLLDADLAEPVAAARRQRDVSAGRARRRVDDQLAARDPRVEVAKLERAAQKVRLELLVGRVVEPCSGLQRAGGCEAGELRIVAPGPLDTDVDGVHADGLARTDAQAHDPPPVVAGRAAADAGIVVPEGPQGVGSLVDRAVCEPPHLRVHEILPLGVARQREVAAHVVGNAPIHPVDLDADCRRGRCARQPARQQKAEQHRRATRRGAA